MSNDQTNSQYASDTPTADHDHGPHCIVAAIHEQTAAIHEQTAAIVRENTIAVNALHQSSGESELLKYLRLQSEERRAMFDSIGHSIYHITDTIAQIANTAFAVERERMSAKGDIKHTEIVKGMSRLAALAAEQNVGLKSDLAALTERIERIEGDCEEGTSPVTSGRFYDEISDLKIEMDKIRARDLDATRDEMEKIKADLKILFGDRI